MTQEGTGGLFPAQDGAPLVILHGKLPVGLQHIGEVLTEQGLRGRTDGIPLLQPLTAAHGNPCALRCEALHMVLFLLQKAFRNQQRHVHILDTLLLKFLIQHILDILPNGIAIRTINKHTFDRGVVDKLGLFAYIGEPLGKVHFHIGNFGNFLFFCHSFQPL